jgi:hypothetical protein
MEELYEYRTELLARSLAVTDDLRQVLGSLPENSLFNSPIQGRPSPHRVLAHLRDIHVQALSKRLKQIQSEESPRFILFDDEAWPSWRNLPALRSRPWQVWILRTPPFGTGLPTTPGLGSALSSGGWSNAWSIQSITWNKFEALCQAWNNNGDPPTFQHPFKIWSMP